MTTILMPDSIDVARLPDYYLAYLGYVDGALIPATVPALRRKFPRAKIVGLTTTGATLDADGCDIERGDLDPASGAAWAARKLKASPGSRPVCYMSRDTVAQVVAELSSAGIPRSKVRLLSAHYGAGQHICGPATCKLPVQCDGTQWTDVYPGIGGDIDMSELSGSFFSNDWQEIMMQQLPTLKQGDIGAAVRTVQGLCNARGFDVAIDAIFGPATALAVRGVQGTRHITQDGIVGPETWPVLLGVA